MRRVYDNKRVYDSSIVCSYSPSNDSVYNNIRLRSQDNNNIVKPSNLKPFAIFQRPTTESEYIQKRHGPSLNKIAKFMKSSNKN